MFDTALSQQRTTAAVSTPNAGTVQRRLPGDPGIWTFITADVGLFFIFFLVFSVERLTNHELYERSRQLLNTGIGLANTLILLTSSLFVVFAVGAARKGNRHWVKRNLLSAILLGSVFAVLKTTEYTLKIQAGITALTNSFFTYYYAFTAIHFMHLVVGMGVLIVCYAKARREPLDEKFMLWIESGGCYWHMVDMLWIILFPMLYLLRAS